MSLEDRLKEVLAALDKQEQELGVIWRLFQNEPPGPFSGWRIADPTEVPPDVRNIGWLRHHMGATVSIRAKGDVWEIGATLFPFSFASYAKSESLADATSELCWALGQAMNIQRANETEPPTIDEVVRAQQEYLANQKQPITPEEALAMAAETNFEIE